MQNYISLDSIFKATKLREKLRNYEPNLTRRWRTESPRRCSWYHKEHRRGRREPEELPREGVADAKSHHPKVVVWCRGGSWSRGPAKPTTRGRPQPGTSPGASPAQPSPASCISSSWLHGDASSKAHHWPSMLIVFEILVCDHNKQHTHYIMNTGMCIY
jgi:hypothetical protein